MDLREAVGDRTFREEGTVTYSDLKDYLANKPARESPHDVLVSAILYVGSDGREFSSNDVRDSLARNGYDLKVKMGNPEAEVGRVYRAVVLDRLVKKCGTEASENAESNRSIVHMYRLTERGLEMARLRFKAAAPPTAAQAQDVLF